MARSYTAECAYRCSVLPLGVFMILGGSVLFGAAMLMPPESIDVPPFLDPWLKRVVFGGVSLLLLPLGLGLCLRSQVAWLGLFVYILVGTTWHIVAGIVNPRFAPLVVLSPLFNIAFAIGVYFATKPVFTRIPNTPQPQSGSLPGGAVPDQMVD